MHLMTPDPYADHEIPLPRLRTISHLWTLAALLGGLGVAALAVDVPLAAWARGNNCPDFIEKISGLSEVFGHGLGIVLIVIVIAVLDPWHRYAIPRIMGASLGAGLAANVVKLLVGRTRPNHCDFAMVDRGLETFASWLPFARNPSWEQSFPSSHMATAAGLAIVLAAFYPRGRWLFPAIAALAGLQRVLHQSHFASDVFWGAAVGCIFAPLCVYGSRLSQSFDRLEAYLIGRTEQIARTRRARQGVVPPPHVGANPMDRAGVA
jgi:membrane-associated phospholipid phosphatase